MNFAKYNIRISLSLSPGEHHITDDRLLHQKTLKILSAVNPRTCAHRLCNSLPPIYPYGYLCAFVILMIVPRRSCCYKMPRNTLHCPENPLSYCLAVLFHMKTLMVISSHLLRIRSSQLFMCLAKFFWILSIFRKSSATCYSWNSCLLALGLIPYD